MLVTNAGARKVEEGGGGLPIRAPRIGGIVWEDSNGDGMLAGENGLSNRNVDLLWVENDPISGLATLNNYDSTKTNADGIYSFPSESGPNVSNGSYLAMIDMPITTTTRGLTTTQHPWKTTQSLGSLDSKHAFFILQNFPPSTAANSKWSRDGKFLMIYTRILPYFHFYSFDGEQLTYIKSPEGLPTATITDAQWAPDGSAIAITYQVAPYFSIIPFNNGVFGAIITPSVQPTTNQYYMNWAPNSTHIALSQNNPPYINVYSWNKSTLTQLANPSTLPEASPNSVKWSPNSLHLALTLGATPFINMYSLSGSILTKRSAPATLPPSSGTSGTFAIAWTANSDYIAIGSNSSPFINVYSFNGTTLTKTANPTTLPSSRPFTLEWSNDGTHLCVGFNASPFFFVYSRSGSTLTKLADPTSIPEAYPRTGIHWTDNDTTLILCGEGAPYIWAYARDGATLSRITIPESLSQDDGVWYSRVPDLSFDDKFLVFPLLKFPHFQVWKKDFRTFTKVEDPKILPYEGTFNDLTNYNPNGAFTKYNGRYVFGVYPDISTAASSRIGVVSKIISLDHSEKNDGVNIGLIRPVILGSMVFEDLDKNGVRNRDGFNAFTEKGFTGWEVGLLDSANNPIGSFIKTPTSGEIYIYPDVTFPNSKTYKIAFVIADNTYTATSKNVGSEPMYNSAANVTMNTLPEIPGRSLFITDPFTINYGDILYKNAGFHRKT